MAIHNDPVALASAYNWAQDNYTGDVREIVNNRNFLGLHPDVFNCIKVPLFRSDANKQSSTNSWIFSGLPNSDTGFNGRSFTECALILLRSQLASMCPNATVSVLNTRKRTSIHVDLGTDPAPCCCGSFIYEPQNASTYSRLADYYNKLGLTPDPGAFITDRTDERYGPGWEENQAEINRISSVICGCLPESNPPGSAEFNMKAKCNDGTFGEWFRENFAYAPSREGTPRKNGPGGPNETPFISDMPQILSCRRFECDYKGGRIRKPSLEFGGLTPYECSKYCRENWSCFLAETTVNPDGPYECKKGGYLWRGVKSEEQCRKTCKRCLQGTAELNDCPDKGYNTLNVEECECQCFEDWNFENGKCRESSSTSSSCLGEGGFPCDMFPCHECNDKGQCVSTCTECQECAEGSCLDRCSSSSSSSYSPLPMMTNDFEIRW
jgi:hypothetical protein